MNRSGSITTKSTPHNSIPRGPKTFKTRQRNATVQGTNHNIYWLRKRERGVDWKEAEARIMPSTCKFQNYISNSFLGFCFFFSMMTLQFVCFIFSYIKQRVMNEDIDLGYESINSFCSMH